MMVKGKVIARQALPRQAVRAPEKVPE